MFSTGMLRCKQGSIAKILSFWVYYNPPNRICKYIWRFAQWFGTLFADTISWGDPVNNEFGNRIREIRKMRGKTQERVAEDCGVSTSTIARWEAGSLRPNQENQKLLANALEVKVDEFYVDSELPVPRNVLLAEILDTLEKLDQPFQLHILRVAQDLVALTHPKSE